VPSVATDNMCWRGRRHFGVIDRAGMVEGFGEEFGGVGRGEVGAGEGGEDVTIFVGVGVEVFSKETGITMGRDFVDSRQDKHHDHAVAAGRRVENAVGETHRGHDGPDESFVVGNGKGRVEQFRVHGRFQGKMYFHPPELRKRRIK